MSDKNYIRRTIGFDKELWDKIEQWNDGQYKRMGGTNYSKAVEAIIREFLDEEKDGLDKFSISELAEAIQAKMGSPYKGCEITIKF